MTPSTGSSSSTTLSPGWWLTLYTQSLPESPPTASSVSRGAAACRDASCSAPPSPPPVAAAVAPEAAAGDLSSSESAHTVPPQSMSYSQWPVAPSTRVTFCAVPPKAQ